jgi:hypothetical protein
VAESAGEAPAEVTVLAMKVGDIIKLREWDGCSREEIHGNPSLAGAKAEVISTTQ